MHNAQEGCPENEWSIPIIVNISFQSKSEHDKSHIHKELVYCNFLKVRLGGWGTEGQKTLSLGRYIRVCEPPFR